MRRVFAIACLLLCALGAAACGTTSSSAGFKGAEHEAAQTISDLQSDITSSERKKICERDLAAPIVAQLGGQSACEAAVKNRLSEIDNTELNVESVKIEGDKATAQVKSVYGGKKQIRDVTLAKEGSRWRITSIG
jgi:hypothetical protein